jgi:hypothetical protein
VTALQIAIKAINNTAGYDSIMPTLLIFRAFSRITHINPPTPLIAQRVIIIKKAIAKVIKLRIQKQVTDALRT